MNFFKATIAAAAVITCSLGNSYPAKAQMSPSEQAAYDFGYATGAVANVCINYQFGEIDSESFVSRVNSISRLDRMTPEMWKIVLGGQSGGKACGDNLTRFGFVRSPVRSPQTSSAVRVY